MIAGRGRRRGLLAGGLVAGVLILAGEAMLNGWLLAADWQALMQRFALPAPSPAVAMQAVLKLILLGMFAVWLARVLRDRFGRRSGIVAGLLVWALVWAWVQWGMLISGLVTAQIALITVAWGLVELPLAVWLGTLVDHRFARRAATAGLRNDQPER